MIERLRVRNFRALRDEQTLDLTATMDRVLLQKNTHETGNHAVPRLLRSAVLFGGNGWGKSAVLDSLRVLKRLVVGEPCAIEPFLLDNRFHDEPTEMELVFFTGATRCILKVATLHGAIIHEDFSLYTTRRPTLLYCRKVSNGEESWEFGARLKGSKAAALRRVDERTLFLARYLERGKHLQEVRAFFEKLVLKSDMDLAHIPHGFWEDLSKDRTLQAQISAFLGSIGTGIEGMVFKDNLDNSKSDAPCFRHAGTRGGAGERALIPFACESYGIKKMVPLAAALFATLAKGGVLVLDGAAALHPLTLRKIVSLFHAADAAKKTSGARQKDGANTEAACAQLLLATHDTSLMQHVGRELRRDQIWFVERTEEGTAELFSLSSFSPRKSEAVERRYYQGQYGALPLAFPEAAP